ncbi:MAG: molybdopterin-dependent oxidoreductase [Rhodoferax sp.]|nr:molybdopterin-dependent oxidoreductase [Pseudorhodobacter sp.]
MFLVLKKLPIAVACAILVLTASWAGAGDFPAPKGDVLLTASGMITLRNGDGTLKLDQAHLAAMPQHSFTTSTTWTDGVPTFQGVLLKDYIAALGATGTTIKLTALNDYQISMPMADVKDDGPLLAYLMDGKPMSLRDKGPIWLVYPYDANADYRTEVAYARSIWQLDRIEFGE